MEIEFECEVSSGFVFEGYLEIDITGTPTPATRYYPGDPLEFEISGVHGEIWDEEMETLRDLTPLERSEVMGIAMNSSSVDYKITDQYEDMRRYPDYYRDEDMDRDR